MSPTCPPRFLRAWSSVNSLLEALTARIAFQHHRRRNRRFCNKQRSAPFIFRKCPFFTSGKSALKVSCPPLSLRCFLRSCSRRTRSFQNIKSLHALRKCYKEPDVSDCSNQAFISLESVALLEFMICPGILPCINVFGVCLGNGGRGACSMETFMLWAFLVLRVAARVLSPWAGRRPGPLWGGGLFCFHLVKYMYSTFM